MTDSATVHSREFATQYVFEVAHAVYDPHGVHLSIREHRRNGYRIEAWGALTPDEARQLAALLQRAADAVDAENLLRRVFPPEDAA